MLPAVVAGTSDSEDVGFGRTGFRNGLRTFADLIGSSIYDKRPLLEVRPKIAVTGWSLFSGSTYQAPFYRPFYAYGDGDQRNLILRDVVMAQSALDAGLTRTETVADCQATAGTYYYDFTEALSTARWDDGVSVWDAGVLTFDTVPKLYVHLEDNSNPSNTTVVAALGFYFSTIGAIHPTLGPNKLPTTAFTLDASNTTMPQNGIASVAGAYYRLSGSYSTDGTQDVSSGIRVVSSGNFYFANGLDTDPAQQTLALNATRGETRHFTFDMRSTGSTLGIRPVWISGGAVAFTNLSLQRIFRFNFYEPRLAPNFLPSYSAGLNDTLFGGSRVGVGAAQLLNGDGTLEADAGDLIWTNAEVRSYFGGVFADGTPLDLSDYQRTFNGSVQNLTGSDKSFSLDMQDLKTFYNTLLPANTYIRSSFPNIDTHYDGKPRPLLFGTVTDITPARLDKVGDYGLYEIADCGDSPQGLFGITTIYSYDDTSSARDLATAKRLTLVLGTDYSADLANGRFTILRDVQPYIVDATNNKLNFDIGAAELTATLTVGTYSATALAAEAQIQLRAAVGGGDVTMSSTYSDVAPHKFTIAKSAGTLNLRTSTGTNKDISGYPLLGFHKDANKTAALSYLADDVTFTDVDTNHILRVDAKGYKDDTSGTFTGTASALVEKGPDIVRYILRRNLKKALSIVDTISFVSARTTAPQLLGAYITDQQTARSLFDALEFSTLSTITVDGSGTAYYDVYVASPGPLAALKDADYLDFALKRNAADIFYQVVVQYAKDPTTGIWQSSSAADAAVAVKYGRLDTRTVDTFLLNRADALFNAQKLQALFGGVARRATLTVKGKILTLRLGQAVSLTRTRAISPPLTGTVFRVVQVQHSYIDGTTSAELLEAV